jgi:uncharacterized membrane protein
MKPLHLLLPAVALTAACASGARQPYAPVGHVSYQAMGAEPFWVLTIGDDLIVLDTGLGQDGAEGGGPATWPRTLPRTVDGVKTWESGDGTSVIGIEARPGPCTTEGAEIYEDHVRVRLSGRELNGCGGRLIGREED